MTAVLFCMAMIIEIVYVFMSPVPKELENKYLLIGTAFICAADFTYHIDYTTIKMYVFALLGTIATSIFLISCVVGVITKCIDFTDLFFTLYMALFQPLLTMVLTSSYELMIVVIIAVVGLGMSIFMVHGEPVRGGKRRHLENILKLSGEKLLHYVDTVNYVYITEYKKSKLYFVTYYTFDKYAEPDRCIIEERGSTAISIIKFGNVPESGTRR